MTRLVTPEQMKRMDERTIQQIGIPGELLMERAALGAMHFLLERFGPLRRVGILCGSGNNGGDGLAMARLLEGEGVHVTLALLTDPAKLRGEAKLNFEILQRLEIEHEVLDGLDEGATAQRLEALPSCEAWCDAIFGIGLSREVKGRFGAAIDFLNRQQRVLAVDVPSGLNARTGQPMGRCVRAHLCATFGAMKTGQALYPGRHLCGETRVIDIGLPERVIEQERLHAIRLDEAWARSHLHARSPTSHKGDAGKILILAGSNSMAGAATLCARGALYGGAGLVTVGTHSEVVARINLAVPEAMSVPLLAKEVYRDRDRLLLQEHLDRAQVIAMGPGIGQHDSLLDVLQHILLDPRQQLVLDADALNLVAHHELLDTLRRGSIQRQIVLTPHPGEMARLSDTSIEDVLHDPMEHAQTLAQVSQCVVVLKTASTVIAAPDGRVAINSSGNPGMASGGMGDTLTGLLAAQLATQPDAFVASGVAVWLHGAAGDACRDARGELATSASGLLDHLGEVLVRMRHATASAELS